MLSALCVTKMWGQCFQLVQGTWPDQLATWKVATTEAKRAGNRPIARILTNPPRPNLAIHFDLCAFAKKFPFEG